MLIEDGLYRSLQRFHLAVLKQKLRISVLYVTPNQINEVFDGPPVNFIP